MMLLWSIGIGLIVIAAALGACLCYIWRELLLPDWDPNSDGFPPEEDLL